MWEICMWVLWCYEFEILFMDWVGVGSLSEFIFDLYEGFVIKLILWVDDMRFSLIVCFVSEDVSLINNER